MPKILCKIERSPVVACSGGADSLAALMFVHNYGKRKPVCLFIDHGTAFSKQSFDHVSNVCEKFNITFHARAIIDRPSKSESKEHFWGHKRRAIYLSNFPRQVITGHTFDDACETFVMKSLSGASDEYRYQKIQDNNIFRPFLLWTKDNCKEYLIKLGVNWIDDPTNFDSSNLRSWMRMRSFVDICDERFSVKSVVRKNLKEQLENKKCTL